MFIAIGGPQAHVTLSMTDTLFQQPARLPFSRLAFAPVFPQGPSQS
jgi:hypothetical protein